MKLVIVHGDTSVEHMKIILGPDGLKRPYKVVTMDFVWREVAGDLKLPIYFFKRKLRMMQFVLARKGDDKPVACVVKDGSDDSDAMAASLHAMNCIEMNVHPTGGT